VTSPRPRSGALAKFLRGEEEASAVLDYVLVLPFFTIIVLTVVQLALLVNAKLVVGYAAFAAARTAAVWIPAELGDEEANRIGGDQKRSQKWSRILSSARIGCLPIASSQMPFGLGSGGAAGDAIGVGVGALMTPLLAHDLVEMDIRVSRAGRKWLWAGAFTEVSIDGVEDSGRTFGATDPIEITVSHRFYLNVALAGSILQPLLAEDDLDRLYDTITVSDSYVLPNQGKLAGM
jgi:hypothetical protein